MNHETINGAKFVRSNDMILNWMERSGEAFEPVTTKWILNALEGRGTFLDVGASTGFFTVPMALKGHRVIAIEPESAIRKEALKPSRGMKGVRSSGVWRTSGASIQGATCASAVKVTVPTVQIDELHLDRVDLIKIDVENHERAVLEGALETIKRDRPHLILEANSEKYQSHLAEILRSLGYRWEPADERNMIAVAK